MDQTANIIDGIFREEANKLNEEIKQLNEASLFYDHCTPEMKLVYDKRSAILKGKMEELATIMDKFVSRY